MIPYVISEAYPDYKRPSVEHDFGVVEEQEMETYFLDKISNFVLDRTGDDDLNLQSINDFFDNYFEEYFMMNAPWSAMIFRNGEWENVTPSNDKILGHIKLLKLQEQEDIQQEDIDKKETQENNEKEENNENNEKECDILDEKDKLILTNIKFFFEKMLEEKPLTPEQIENLQKMNQIEQLSSLFNIYLTIENYKENEHLFKDFLNICLKFLQKDIELITKKMENEESDELSIRLKNALEVYSSTILIKQSFNF